MEKKFTLFVSEFPQNRSEEKVAIVIMDRVLLIQYSQNAIY